MVEVTTGVMVIATEVGAAESLPHGVFWVHNAQCNGKRRYFRERLIRCGVLSWLLIVGKKRMNVKYMGVKYMGVKYMGVKYMSYYSLFSHGACPCLYR